MKKEENVQFKKSSFCNTCTCCVEVAICDDKVFLRDSKKPNRKPFVFTKEEWNSFKQGILNGEF